MSKRLQAGTGNAPAIAGQGPLRVAFGPEMAGWGSWAWVGEDLVKELRKYFQTAVFTGQEVPECDVAVIVKHALSADAVARVCRHSAVLYCPVDYYGRAGDIDADALTLRKCARVIVHCERMRKYFEPYALVEYMDHHVKFCPPIRENYKREGYILWVGVRTNLEPLVQWVNVHTLPAELRILTNLAEPEKIPDPEDLGFRPGLNVRVQNWTPEQHLDWAAGARAAIDIKGTDFRSRNKPPAKAIDFIAAGIPLAMNSDSSAVEYLSRMGFDIVSPVEEDWLSPDYWQETQRFGRVLRELFAVERIGRRYKYMIDDVWAQRRMA